MHNALRILHNLTVGCLKCAKLWAADLKGDKREAEVWEHLESGKTRG